ncbi:calcium-binding protein [Roseateles sp. BYS96W]|uniref:Calcium-binding protein n=1 Tax=Pelomonas nitida TaxID=3299027 RepID=A0ABW7G6C3_9BURK
MATNNTANPDTTPQVLQAYALLQIAAEAFLNNTKRDDPAAAPTGSGSFTPTAAMLTDGNLHSSKMTAQQAKDFGENWRVVSHQPNTATGFSATLFEYVGTGPQPTASKYVVSFRSTEFIEDGARDNQATNVLELKEGGWAFGQLADMQLWWNSSTVQAAVAGKKVDVTGYSLGGSLATSFQILHGESVDKVYTFNGAGVGEVKQSYGGLGSLARILADFDAQRADGSAGNKALFKDSLALSKYQELAAKLNRSSTLSAAQIAEELAGLKALIDVAEQDALNTGTRNRDRIEELQLLRKAVDRSRSIAAEAERVPTLVPGDGGATPANIKGFANIDALRLDYQLAVLTAMEKTQGASTPAELVKLIKETAGFGNKGRDTRGLENVYDVFGAPPPSAVSNSQHHLGNNVPVFIEDQPLVRGSYLAETFKASLAAWELKLLPNNYKNNDFGDTHSIALLADSLRVQSVVADLAPGSSLTELGDLLQAASNKKADSELGQQGRTDGDTVESLLDSIRRLLVGPRAEATLNNESLRDKALTGGTWAELDLRQRLENSVLELSGAIQELRGQLIATNSDAGLGSAARNDFGAFASIYALSTVRLAGKDAAGSVELERYLGSIWNGENAQLDNLGIYTAWDNDRNMSAADIDAGAQTFTQTWMTSRAAMLGQLVTRNIDNTPDNAPSARPYIPGQPTHFEDRGTQRSFDIGLIREDGALNQVIFGADGNDAIAGLAERDSLFGGAGADFLSGNGGNDYIEGNAGIDQLDGGEGNDTLIGGTGDDELKGGANNDSLIAGVGVDTLVGGSGDDFLNGGAGFDTYFFDANFGNDIVSDTDGIGELKFAAIPGGLPIGFKVSDGLYLSEDGRVTYSLVPGTDGRTDLLVTIKDSKDSVLIRNWTPSQAAASNAFGLMRAAQASNSGNLGIRLEDRTTAPPSTSHVLQGDFEKQVYNHNYLLSFTGYVNAGPQANAQDILWGLPGDDVMQGLGGNDGISGFDGDDWIDGGEGNDLLLGGRGRDTMLGGAGNDLIFGSAVGQIYRPESDIFTAPTGSDVEIARGFSWAAYRRAIDRITEDGSTFVFVSFAGADVVEGWRGEDGQTYVEGTGNIIDAGAGNDFVAAGTGDDSVRGGDGDDDIAGKEGSDALFGDAGDDIIYGDGPDDDDSVGYGVVPAQFHGDDILSGGAGSDWLIGNGGDDYLYGGADDDHLYGDDSFANGTPASVNGNDYLDGGDGNDGLTGGGRDDRLFGGSGNDLIWGDGNQSDIEVSVHGVDYLDGGDGDDQLIGGGNDDQLLGGVGDDTMWGDATAQYVAESAHGNDFMDGGDGRDMMAGGGGADTMLGGAGDDQLQGDDFVSNVMASAHGNDYLDGGDGDDSLIGGGGDDVLLGGNGKDLMRGDDAVDSVPDVSAGADYLDGQGGDDNLKGGAGNDTLLGGDGTDMIQGGAGDDLLIGGAGADVMLGGAGNDIYFIGATESSNGITADTITDTQGRDTLIFSGVDLEGLTVDWLNNAIWLGWGSTQGVYLASGASSSISTVQSDVGQSVSLLALVGQRLQKVISQSTQQDNSVVFGGAKNDYLTVTNAGVNASGGRGVDNILIAIDQGSVVTMNVGDGTDVVSAVQRGAANGSSPAPENVLQLGEGFEASKVRLYRVGVSSFVLALNELGDGVAFSATAAADGSVSAGLQPFDRIAFSDGTALTWRQVVDRGIGTVPTATIGDDVLSLSPASDELGGMQGNDRIDGLAGNDLILGQEGDDTLLGGLGNDTLYAGVGRDSLVGGEGDDYLYGGDSNSIVVMEGGEGTDSYFFRYGYYIYTTANSNDTSLTSDDKYRINDSGYVGGGEINSWRISDAGGSADELIFDSRVPTKSNTFVESNGTGFTLTNYNLVVEINGAVNDLGKLSTGSIEKIRFSNGDFWTAEQLLSMSQATTSGNDTVGGFGSNDTIDGGAGDDSIRGYAGDDVLIGGAGYDTLSGGIGNDEMRAGPGGGHLVGDEGDDVYRIGAGEANVKIGGTYRGSNEDLGRDTLKISANRSDVTISLVRDTTSPNNKVDNLTIVWNDKSTSVSFALFGNQNSDLGSVDNIQFLDGSILNVAQYVSGLMVPASASDEEIVLTSLDDVVQAGDGNDVVKGGSGNDSIYGGNGNDALYGEGGSDFMDGGAGDDWIWVDQRDADSPDTVVFGLGSGHDTLSGTNTGAGADVKLGESIKLDELRLRWDAPSFYSQYDNNGDSRYAPSWSAGLVVSVGTGIDTLNVSVFNGGYTSQSPLGKLKFADGAELTISQLVNLANTSTAGNDLLFNALGNVDVSGGAGDDTIYGLQGGGLQGGDGRDLLYGGDVDDRMIGGAGDDTIAGGHGSNVVVYSKGDGNDAVWVQYGGETQIEFGEGVMPSDVIARHTDTGIFRLDIVGGGSITVSPPFLPFPPGAEIPSRVYFKDGTVWERQQLAELMLSGSSENDSIVGTKSSDVIYGQDGDDTLTGWLGSDTLNGGTGNDLLFAALSDEVDPNSTDVLTGGAGNDVLWNTGSNGIYHFDPGFGHDLIYAASHDASLIGAVRFGAGILPIHVVTSHGREGSLILSLPTTGESIEIERFFADDLSDALAEPSPIDEVRFDNGVVWSISDIVSRLASATTEASDLIQGTAGDDVLDGLGGNDLIDAGAGDDSVLGGAGGDHLIGGDGDDTLKGGDGYDSIEGGAGTDQILFSRGDGIDTLNNVAGDELVLGSGIAATDLAFLRQSSDLLIEISGVNDSILVPEFLNLENWISIRLADGSTISSSTIFEAIATTNGTASNDSINGANYGERINGLAGNDTLNGLGGNDTLDGGAGNDRLVGGKGNDVFIVDSTSDTVVEVTGEGIDEVRASVTYTLPSNVENLELQGTDNINGTGNSGNNKLGGNGGNNVLTGAAGNDELLGMDGNDSLVGGSGDDSMRGGAGDDSYDVDSTADAITEDVNQGSDSVSSSVTYQLPANVENLTLTGTSGLTATGNDLANILTGNSGANRLVGGGGNDALNGGAGADTLVGGAGDDTYSVDATTDVVTENVAEGVDTILTSVTLPSLATNVENLTLTGASNLNATGNGANNVLTGNGGANRLDGGAGADTMIGGAGNDTYVVDNAGDVITEISGGGADAVEASMTYTLGAELEKLTLIGSGAFDATGNDQANTLTGNSENNRLNGGAGNDTMVGGAGNDTYVVDSASDVVTEASSGGNDTVEASISYTLGSEVENLTLTGTSAINATGNSVANILRGNAGDNTLDGKAGNDSMIGGAGNDIYVIDATTDVVTELAGEGTDTIQSSVTLTSLAANVENLTLTGTTALNGTGNALANILTGNSAANSLSGGDGDDTLDGGAGTDTLIGGLGNDTFYVDSTSDVVTEANSAGTDTIMTSVTLASLAANVENLTLIGTGNINASGSTGDNVLTGNAGNNTLTGNAGNDTLDGKAGNDTLNGGAGADTYWFGTGYGSDMIIDSDSTANIKDVVRFGAGIVQTDIKFTQSGNALVATLKSTSEALTIQDWYLSSNNRVEEFRFSDGTVLTNVQAQALVGAMAAFSPSGTVITMVREPEQHLLRHNGFAVSGTA